MERMTTEATDTPRLLAYTPAGMTDARTYELACDVARDAIEYMGMELCSEAPRGAAEAAVEVYLDADWIAFADDIDRTRFTDLAGRVITALLSRTR